MSGTRGRRAGGLMSVVAALLLAGCGEAAMTSSAATPSPRPTAAGPSPYTAASSQAAIRRASPGVNFNCADVSPLAAKTTPPAAESASCVAGDGTTFQLLIYPDPAAAGNAAGSFGPSGLNKPIAQGQNVLIAFASRGAVDTSLTASVISVAVVSLRGAP